MPSDIGPEIERALDNPIWECLGTCHAHLASGNALARRYRSDISPLTGVARAGEDVAASLETLVEIGDDVSIFGRYVPAPGANWEVLREPRITQMIRRDRTPLPEPGTPALQLGATDVPDMLELVELTQPGPFRQRTIELGGYIGLRESGRLVAMAGERMWIGHYREVSAICTHPEVRARGHARALIARVVNRILQARQVPFLHVISANTRAIDVYSSLGFVSRTEFALLHMRRLR